MVRSTTRGQGSAGSCDAGFAAGAAGAATAAGAGCAVAMAEAQSSAATASANGAERRATIMISRISRSWGRTRRNSWRLLHYRSLSWNRAARLRTSLPPKQAETPAVRPVRGGTSSGRRRSVWSAAGLRWADADPIRWQQSRPSLRIARHAHARADALPRPCSRPPARWRRPHVRRRCPGVGNDSAGARGPCARSRRRGALAAEGERRAVAAADRRDRRPSRDARAARRRRGSSATSSRRSASPCSAAVAAA